MAIRITKEGVDIPFVPSITIPLEKYDRLVAAEAKLDLLPTLFKFIPSYQIADALAALAGKKEDATPDAQPTSDSGTVPAVIETVDPVDASEIAAGTLEAIPHA